MYLVNLKNKKGEKSLEDEAWGIIIKSDSEDWELIGNRQLYSDFKAGKKTGHPVGRYWVQDDGTARKCDPKDSSKFLDGSKVPLDKGQFMVYLPRLYYLVKEDKENNRRYLWMSDHDIGGHYLESSMIGAFLSTNYDGKAYSRPSDNIGKDWSMVSSFERNQAIGKNFDNMDYDQWRYLIMLHLSEFGTANIQSTIRDGGDSDNNVGNTLQCGDSIGYYKRNSSDIETNKKAYGKQNFLGIEGIVNKYTWCGGLLNTTDSIYLYKDPNNLYKTKEEITKLGEGNYRVIKKISNLTYGWVGDIICGDYFDVFISKEATSFHNNWGGYQSSLFKYNNGVITLFGDNYGQGANVYCGLIKAHVTFFNDYDSSKACRNGYFGTIKFI